MFAGFWHSAVLRPIVLGCFAGSLAWMPHIFAFLCATYKPPILGLLLESYRFDRILFMSG